MFDTEGRLVASLSDGLDDYELVGDCYVPSVITRADPTEHGETLVYAWAALRGLCDAEPDHALCVPAPCAAPGGCHAAPGATPSPAWWLVASLALFRWRRAPQT